MKSFEKVSGALAIAAGVSAFLYSLAFVVVSKNNPVLGGALSALLLLIFGLLATGAWTGLYRKLKEVDQGFAIWVLILAIAGSLGAAIHGGYDLSNALNPPAVLDTTLPSQIDPRGLLTFGLSGLALLLASLMTSNHKKMPSNLATVGYLAGLLSVFLYLGRLIIVDATSLVIVIPALVNGFIVGPVWYVWLGRVLKEK